MSIIWPVRRWRTPAGHKRNDFDVSVPDKIDVEAYIACGRYLKAYRKCGLSRHLVIIIMSLSLSLCFRETRSISQFMHNSHYFISSQLSRKQKSLVIFLSFFKIVVRIFPINGLKVRSKETTLLQYLYIMNGS